MLGKKETARNNTAAAGGSAASAPKKRGLLSRIFHRKSSAPAPEQAPRAAEPPKPTALESSAAKEKRLISNDHLAEVAQYKGDPAVDSAIEAFFFFKGAAQSQKVPSATEGDFKKKMAHINENVMTEHANMQQAFVSASQTLAADTSAPWKINAAMMFASLANLAHTQELKLNKIYDDVMTAFIAGNIANFEGKNYYELFASTEVYKFNSKSAKALGSGAINTVYKDSFQGKQRVFKQGSVHIQREEEKPESMEPQNVGLGVYEKRLGHAEERLSGYEGDTRTGIRNAFTAQRDVAVSRISKLLGLDIAVDTQLAMGEEGNAASLMDMAGGGTIGNMTIFEGRENEAAAQAWTKADLATQAAFLEEQANNPVIAAEGKEKMLKEAAGLRAKLAAAQGSQGAPAMDVMNPAVAMEMFKMAVLDIICGHVDRHTGNYHAEAGEHGAAKIHAIDNDTSFGVNTDVDHKGAYEEQNEHHATLSEAFPFVPAEVKAKVTSVDESDIRGALTGLLSKPQIDAAAVRFGALKKHLESIKEMDMSGEGVIREQLEALASKDSTKNYLATAATGSLTKRYGEEQAMSESRREMLIKGAGHVPVPKPAERQ